MALPVETKRRVKAGAAPATGGPGAAANSPRKGAGCHGLNPDIPLKMKKLNVAIVGCGFMGRTHSNAYCKIGNFFDVPYEIVRKTICDFNEEKARAHAARWGFESVETDWRRLLDREDIDIVDICLPNNMHAEPMEPRQLSGMQFPYAFPHKSLTLSDGRWLCFALHTSPLVLTV